MSAGVALIEKRVYRHVLGADQKCFDKKKFLDFAPCGPAGGNRPPAHKWAKPIWPAVFLKFFLILPTSQGVVLNILKFAEAIFCLRREIVKNAFFTYLE